MRKNLNNLSILFIVWLFLALGCGSSQSGETDDSSRDVERGRLKYSVSANELHIGQTPIIRSVHGSFYVNGKSWSPPEDKSLAERLNWCDTSPNPKVEILRCFGDASENYKTTYIIGMKDDKPYLLKANEGLPSYWIDDDGRWMLFKREYFNVETGEKIGVKGIPFADDEMSSFNLIGVSPDMKTIVTIINTSPDREGNEEFLYLQIIDAATGETEKRKVSFTKNHWLNDYKQPTGQIAFPPVTAKNLVWTKGADGRDKLVVPKLLEQVKKK